MDAEQKKHNERVMEAMKTQSGLLVNFQLAVTNLGEQVVKAIAAAESIDSIVEAVTLSDPILSRALDHIKFQSWCAAELTKVNNIGSTLEVQAKYEQMLLDSGQVIPPAKDPECKKGVGPFNEDPKRKKEPSEQEGLYTVGEEAGETGTRPLDPDTSGD